MLRCMFAEICQSIPLTVLFLDMERNIVSEAGNIHMLYIAYIVEEEVSKIYKFGYMQYK